MSTKRPYLVSYDGGQGELLAYVLAESPQQIKVAFPFAELLVERPPWLSDAILATLRTYDVHTPEGWLTMRQDDHDAS